MGRRRVFALAVLLSALLTVHLAMLGSASFAQTDPSPTPADASPSDTLSPSPTDTPSPSPTDTPSPSPTDSASPSASPSDTASPSPSPSASLSPSPSTSPLVSPSANLAGTATTSDLEAIILGQ